MVGTSTSTLGSPLGLWLWLVVVAALAGLAAPAAAQAPKSGNDYFEETTRYGFRVKYPKDWDFVPPNPDEINDIGMFSAEDNSAVQITPEHWINLAYWVVCFDNREANKPVVEDQDSTRTVRLGPKPMKSMEEWIDASGWMSISRAKPFLVEKSKQRKVDGFEAVEAEYLGEFSADAPVRLYTLVVELEPGLEIGIVGIGPGNKKWSKYGSVYQKLARTFKSMELEQVDMNYTAVGTDTPLRQKKRAELMAEVASQPGWNLDETEHYFIVSSTDDTQFVREAKDRVEAIRKVLVENFSPDEAKALIQKIKAERAANGEQDEDEDKKSGGQSRVIVDPMELARTSVLRICKDRNEYLSYGAPGSSVGYWHPGHQELVVYDDKAGRGRNATWATLSHEAFHQYIFYFYGALSPHSWYNEGTGDFFGGFEYRGGKFRQRADNDNLREVQSMLRDDEFAPLSELVRMSQREYYGNNKYEIGGFSMYSQGWSMVWFLRTGKGQARGWNNDWNGILATYLETLLVTEDLEEAVDKAFAGVDWDEMTTCWKNYIK